MNVILFGASGMVGQGVLRECLLNPDVQSVLSIGRTPINQRHEKLREIIHKDFSDFTPIENQLKGFDACFFCLGISSLGMTEADYSRVSFDFTLAPARILAEQNPSMTFIYVSGAGTDSTEKGRVMWARVKGKTENALRKLPFKAAYMFRPGLIQPLHGIKSKTPLYQIPYVILGPFIPFLTRFLPNHVTTTERVGRAMINAAKNGAPTPFLENREINELAQP